MTKSMLVQCVAPVFIGAVVWASNVAKGQDDVLVPSGVLQNTLKLFQTPSDDGKQTVVFALADDPAANVPQSDYWLGVQVAALPEVVKKQLVLEDGLAVEEVTPTVQRPKPKSGNTTFWSKRDDR